MWVLHSLKGFFLMFLSAPSSQESPPKKHLQHEAVSRLQSPVGIRDDDKESNTRNFVGADKLEQQQQLNPVKD